MASRSSWQIIVACLLLLVVAANILVAQQASADARYGLQVLVIRAEGEEYLEPLQHLLNTVHANTSVTAIPIEQLTARRLARADIVYPDPSILQSDAWQPERAAQLWQQFVAQGGHLFLEHPFLTQLPADFLGIADWQPLPDGTELNVTYPAVSRDLVDLQQVYRAYIEGITEYDILAGHPLCLEHAPRVSTATSLVDLAGLSLLCVNAHQRGTVTWANRLLPSRTFISRLDFLPSQPEQPYFHYGNATANWLLRSKYLTMVAKHKYGFAVEKILGPYHRPGMAWQNHFEVNQAFAQQDIQDFTQLLRHYRQVPTFSFIRGTFKWSYWNCSLVWLPNVGSPEQPAYEGMLPDSFYSTGQRVTTADGSHLQLGHYRGFSSLLGRLENPARAYPTLVDANGTGGFDLIVGTPDGHIYWCTLQTEAGRLVCQQQKQLTASGQSIFTPFAAPAAADLNGDGLVDLVVGGQDGRLCVYQNVGSQSQPAFALRQTLSPRLGAYTAPQLVDWDGDGVLDLLVGVANGDIYVLPGQPSPQGIAFGTPQLLLATGLQWAAPHAADWNADGQLDLLVGSYDGQVALFQLVDGSWQRQPNLQGQNLNFFGQPDLNIGHNSVPLLVDVEGTGRPGLLLGGVEYGDPYALDDPANPARDGIQACFAYLQDNHLPILVHSYIHEFKSAVAEQEELKLHRQAFQHFGYEWRDMGVNHHTWRINQNALQTFAAEQAAGIYYDFGFHPFGAPGQPRSGQSFLPWVAPWRLTIGEQPQPFLLWCPVPEVCRYPLAYQHMQACDLPLTYFDHIENRLTPGTQERRNLVQTIEALAGIQQRGNYNFMTEQQIAQSLLNHYYCQLNIDIQADGIVMDIDASQVPEAAGSYRGALGVRILRGQRLAAAELSTDAWLRYRQPESDDLYVGLLGPTQVVWGQQPLPAPPLEIWRTNSPVQVLSSVVGTVVMELDAPGMQQIVFRSSAPLRITGEDLIIDRNDDLYTVTHYGASCRITLHLR